jgi:SPP1 family predicted phage head-tail adaptor
MPAQLQSGDLDTLVALRRATTVRSALNEPVETWSTLAEAWARRADVSAREGTRAQEVGASLSTRFTVRQDPITETLTPKDRIQVDGVEFNIIGIRSKVDDRNHWLELDTVARDDRG